MRSSETRTRLKAGAAAVKVLKKGGVRHVFGLPGSQVIEMLDAIYGEGDVRFITTRHEQVAASMADGYARATGRPGVCMVTTGAGAANAVVSVTTALKDSSPVVLLTGEQEPRMRMKNTFNSWDQLGAFRSITKWQRQPGSADEVPVAVAQAMNICQAGRPGPVHVNIPKDLQRLEVDFPEGNLLVTSFPRLSPADSDVAQACELLAAATRPVIFAGGGVVSSGASEALLKFAELLSIPIVTSLGAKGCVSEDHPLSWGVAGREGLGAANRGFADSDLVIGLGTRFSDISTLDWTIVAKGSKIIQVDVDVAEIGANYPVTLGILGDVKAFLEALTKALTPGGVAHPFASRAGEIRRRVDEERREFFSGDAKGKVEPQALVRTVNEVISKDSIVTIGAGRHSSYACKVMRYGSRTFLKSVSLGAMGFAVPAAMGAKTAFPERQVVALVGDGDFVMVSQDVSTAVREGLNIVVVIFNDNSYSSQKRLQREKYGSRFIGTDVTNPDFVKFAEAFRAGGSHAESPSELKSALTRALASDRPEIIDVAVTPI